MTRTFSTFTALTLLALATAPRLFAQDDGERNTAPAAVLLIGARILPIADEPIERGAILLRDGKIEAIYTQMADAPIDGEDLDVIDVTGRWITPGLVDANTTLGLSNSDANEQGDEVTPQLSVLDAIDPADPEFRRAALAGTTTVQINPGNRNVFGGRGAIVKTAGGTIARMVVRDESGVRMVLGREPGIGNTTFAGSARAFFRRPTTRMGVIWEARKAFYDAAAYRETATDGQPQERDRAMETLVRALDGELTVRSTARAEQDIRTALRLAEEFGYSTLVDEGTEAWRVLDELAATDTKVLFSAPSAASVSGMGASDGAEPRWGTLPLFAERGIGFAICTGSDPTGLPLVQEAMFAVRYGLDRDRALTAVTLDAARILGIEDRVGSLTPGRDADLVVWSGDPFSPTSRAESVYIDGRRISR